MATALSAKKILNTGECSICTEIYSDPRSLPCIHSYCYNCISNWCKDKQPGDKVACPLCRQEFGIPEGGVGDLPNNVFIGKMLRIKELKSPENEVKLCDLCSAHDEGATQNSEKTACSFCLECQQNLCKSCCQVHGKLNNTSAHTVLSPEELASGKEIYTKYPSTFCEKHRDESLKMYCFDCTTTMCTLCYIQDHKAHKGAEVTEIESEFRAGLARDVESVTTSMHKLDEKLKVVQSKRTSLREQVTKVETEISERADRLKKDIDVGKQKLVADLYELQACLEKQMDHLVEEIAQCMCLLEGLNKYTNELLKRGTACDVARHAESIHRRSETLGNVELVEDECNKLSVVNVLLSQSNVTIDPTILGEVFDEGMSGLICTCMQ